MIESKLEIKLSFVAGLREIVLKELGRNNLQIIREIPDSFYVELPSNPEFGLVTIQKLRSVSRAYVVLQHPKYNPLYLSHHKSILGDLIRMVITTNGPSAFKTFKIACAGSDSSEVREIATYVEEKFSLVEKEEADLKIHIAKIDEGWEIGIQITPRPLSVRDYKMNNLSGAMDPTIAYALNDLCALDTAESHLNIFSGSATLLIEAGLSYPHLTKLIGFDNNKEHLSLAMQNIKEAGLIRRIELKEKDIFEKPDLGTFDVITSDLPFGMAISKNEDLESLYRCFVDYCQETLNKNGSLVMYTSQHEILEKILKESAFEIIKTLELKIVTSVNSYLRPKIFVCRFS
jgi:23S rRNA G2445 N2-methylase RlmL